MPCYSRHAPTALAPGKRHDTLCTGNWDSLRVGLNGCGKSEPHGDSIPDRPVRSESLYKLHYPDTYIHFILL